MTATNRFKSSASNQANFVDAIDECISQIQAELDSADLLFCFFAEHTEDKDLEQGLSLLTQAFPEGKLAGCNTVATLANGQEFENCPSVVLWAGQLPATTIEILHLQYQRTLEGAAFAGFPSRLDHLTPDAEDLNRRTTLIAIGDPFTFPMDLFLERINEDHPGVPVIGGMASAASTPGETRLICDRQVVNHGSVFVLLQSESVLATVVSQGCRPIGETFVVTKAERNQIFELGGKPAVEQLKRIYRELPTSEQRSIQMGLHLGVAITEYRDAFGYGDFLIRNVIGVDEGEGSINMGDFVRIGQTVQFHVRDFESADVDLRQSLVSSRASQAPFDPAAALIFTCNGRGLNLFPEPHHDAAAVNKTMGEITTAGFFAAGEIGPVGGRNFMHGFTCSILWFGQ